MKLLFVCETGITPNSEFEFCNYTIHIGIQSINQSINLFNMNMHKNSLQRICSGDQISTSMLVDTRQKRSALTGAQVNRPIM